MLELPRFFQSDELRIIEVDGKRKLVGHAAVFNSLSNDLGGFREKIAPGAFGDVLRSGQEVLALVNHDTSKVLARKSAGTLALREDERGLYAEIDLADTTLARDTAEDVKCKNVKGMSFRMRNVKDTWEQRDGAAVRTVLKIGTMLEVSVTPIPAYEGTSVALRGLIGDDAEIRAYYADQIKKLSGTPALDIRERAHRLMTI